MEPRLLLDSQQLHITMQRLCCQILEQNLSLDDIIIIGLQPRGILFSDRIVAMLRMFQPNIHLDYGKLDITFYRDDFRQSDKLHLPDATDITFLIENKHVIIIDDVFYTGRSVRAALDALLDYGRPRKVELMVLVNRKYHHHVPVQPDYIGISVDTIVSQKVCVEWKVDDKTTDQVWILQEPKSAKE